MSYKDLKSYQQATILYDYTLEFCERYIKNHKIVTQMVGAARDGKQNIVEAAENKTSMKIKLNLLGASRFSLGELKGDYEDFLRQNNLEQWDKNDRRATEVRQLVYKINKNNRPDKSYKTYYAYSTYLNYSESAANVALCLIHQASFLVDQQIRSEEKHLREEGDYADKLKYDRLNVRRKQDQEADEWLREELRKLKSNEGI